MEHLLEMKPGALRPATETPAPKPLPAPAEDMASRLAVCLAKCGRSQESLCVLHCCGSQPLRIVAGWLLHSCGKNHWK